MTKQTESGISTEEYFGELKMLFLTKGWGYLKAQLESELDPLLDISSVSTERDLFYRQGQILVLRNLINLESVLEQAEQTNASSENTSLED